METVYSICAAVGGTLIVLQFVMTLMGMGGDHDVDAGGHDFGGHDVGGNDLGQDVGGHDMDVHDAGGHDASADHSSEGHQAQGHHATNWLFGVISFRTLVAGAAFFGLTGLAMEQAGAEAPLSIVTALAGGGIAIFIVAWVMRSLSQLNVDGTVRIRQALGSTGTVYLPIPGGKVGMGKVHVSVGGRLMEYRAITSFADLPSGTKVVVVKVVGSDTVEVSPVESLEATRT